MIFIWDNYLWINFLYIYIYTLLANPLSILFIYLFKVLIRKRAFSWFCTVFSLPLQHQNILWFSHVILVSHIPPVLTSHGQLGDDGDAVVVWMDPCTRPSFLHSRHEVRQAWAREYSNTEKVGTAQTLTWPWISGKAALSFCSGRRQAHELWERRPKR